MAIKYQCAIPQTNGQNLIIELFVGETTVVVGANGSGKTRFGVLVEQQIEHSKVHRIAAQKSLRLNDKLSLISLERAERLLRIGEDTEQAQLKSLRRWGNSPATHLLSDFDALLQSLFAEHNKIASAHLQARKLDPDTPIPITKLERLKAIWNSLLPHRALDFDDANIRVSPTIDGQREQEYTGSEMSDGERGIFYFLGQCLLAPPDGILIVDEPESHIHKAILASLWDTIEAARPDCGFLYITHDLEFAASRNAAHKFFIKSYRHRPIAWEIEEIPRDTGLPENVVMELVGSRRPILFVEGDKGSLDLSFYRHVYRKYTIVPAGSCDSVKHSVATYRSSNTLHWLEAYGIVDADHRSQNEITRLQSEGVYTLPVMEIESVLLMPKVFLELAKTLQCADPTRVLQDLTSDVVQDAQRHLDLISTRYAVRRIDRRLKSLGLRANDLGSLVSEFNSQLATVDPSALFNELKNELTTYITNRDLAKILGVYDNKGLLSRAAIRLGLRDTKHMVEKATLLLTQSVGLKLKQEPSDSLPQMPS